MNLFHKEYLDRIRAIREQKEPFSENYRIERLNESRNLVRSQAH